MRNTIYTVLMIVFIGVSFKSAGQIKRSFDTCQTLRQFDGEWIGIHSDDTIKVFFRTHKFESQDFSEVSSELLGWHEYKKGNSLVQSDYSKRRDDISKRAKEKTKRINSINLRLSNCFDSSGYLYGFMNDFNKGRCQRWRIDRIANGKLRVSQTMCGNVIGQEFRTGYTLPQTFILTRR